MVEEQVIMEARCIVWVHHCTLWERENPELVAEGLAIVAAWTPAQRLAWTEAMDDIQRLLETIQ